MVETPSTRSSLLIRLRDPRDERAWAEFVEIYEPLVLGLARRRGLQGADADDLAQEVFCAVASAIGRWDSDPARGSLRGWLFRVARNLTVDLLTIRKWQPRGSGDTDARRLLEEVPGPAGEDSELFDDEYRRRLFDWAAGRIRDEFPEVAWRAFWMAGVEGRSGADVAETLETTVGTVYYYKSTVMSRLRREIEHVEGR
jgi:RNA polymerase sigma-70 factor (ECF subfamily)